jgi:hypothetical protein
VKSRSASPTLNSRLRSSFRWNSLTASASAAFWSGAATVPRAGPARLAFSHAARNLAIASTRVAAAPFVTPGVPGTMVMIDHPRNSGGRRWSHGNYTKRVRLQRRSACRACRRRAVPRRAVSSREAFHLKTDMTSCENRIGYLWPPHLALPERKRHLHNNR